MRFTGRASVELRPRRPAPLDGTAPWRSRHPWPQSAHGLAPWLDGRLGSARQFHQHAQRFHHGTLADGGAADRAETEFAVENLSVARGDREMYQAYRLARRRA